MTDGDYKGTWLHKEQYDFIFDWLSKLKKNKRRTNDNINLKLFCERYFFYISGKDIHKIMNEVPDLKGDRWFHNVKREDLIKMERILDNKHRPWYQSNEEMFRAINELRYILEI